MERLTVRESIMMEYQSADVSAIKKWIAENDLPAVFTVEQMTGFLFSDLMFPCDYDIAAALFQSGYSEKVTYDKNGFPMMIWKKTD